MLTLQIPVAPAAKPRRIEVRGTARTRETIDVEANPGDGQQA